MQLAPLPLSFTFHTPHSRHHGLPIAFFDVIRSSWRAIVRVASASGSRARWFPRTCVVRRLPAPQLPLQLVHSRERHEQVDAEQVVVGWPDLRAVTRPNDAGGRDRHLLRIRHTFHRSLEVGDVGERNPPFERRCPEVDGLGTCRMVPKRLCARREAHRHDATRVRPPPTPQDPSTPGIRTPLPFELGPRHRRFPKGVLVPRRIVDGPHVTDVVVRGGGSRGTCTTWKEKNTWEGRCKPQSPPGSHSNATTQDGSRPTQVGTRGWPNSKSVRANTSGRRREFKVVRWHPPRTCMRSGKRCEGRARLKQR